MVASLASGRREVGGTLLSGINAEEQGISSAQYPYLHTGGGAQPNTAHTIEHIKQETSENASPDEI